MERAANSLGERARQYSPPQQRTIAAAMALFIDHGISETSLQMIANAVGVTKAAIYHQFKTKEAIVAAVAEVQLVGLEEAVDRALEQGSSAAVRRQLLAQLIEMAVSRRKAVWTFLNDPILVRHLNGQALYQRLMSRTLAVLFGHQSSDRTLVRAAVLAEALGAPSNHFVAELDDATLQRELLEVLLPLLAHEV